MSLLQVSSLNGWWVRRCDFHGRECWVATRHGVSMNINSYEGIISMILNRPY